jgi:hypothetical protein
MRLLLVVAALLTLSLDVGVGQPIIPRGRLYRGPLVSDREATLVVPERGVPLQFGQARLDLGGPGPFATLSPTRLRVSLGSRTVRPVLIAGITLRVAFGPADDGMVTFRMRGMGGAQVPPELHVLPQNGVFRPAIFLPVSDANYPSLLLLDPATRVVFTVERIDGINGPPIFDNPDATELLWEALGRPSLSP